MNISSAARQQTGYSVNSVGITSKKIKTELFMFNRAINCAISDGLNHRFINLL